MWTLSRIFVILIFFCVPFFASSQPCDLKISGIVQDLNTGDPIAYANIFLKESQSGVVSDSLGFFRIKSVCPGRYHLQVSHVGCETQELYLQLERDTSIVVFMDHHSQLLNEITIVQQTGKISTQEAQSINARDISEKAHQNLATMLENISGVSTIKNGSGISKPVVHGLYGNRLTILNNGVAQSGQQWGVDHSPEIDPLVANRITVIKGVGALEYMGNSLGSIVLVEPKRIEKDPHLHGEARYFFESNGLGNGLNISLQQYNQKLAWRAVGTLKKSGDNHTSQYYLRNTGNQEANIALQLEKSFDNKWFTDLYFSSFNAKLGVLRGAHIGNLTDLEEALNRDVPFYTRGEFSYSIAAPYQSVNHHLLKFHSKYLIDDTQWVDFTYAGQFNARKEFDVRRSGRSDLPALSLEQFSHFLEGKYKNHLRNNWELNTGIQFNRIANTNVPETGILPLIPDYIAYEYGVFGIMNKRLNKASFEFGGRYDIADRRVATISASTPREIVRYRNNFHNLSAMGGIKYEFSRSFKMAYNIGYASRNPEVNELYSNGLHQGVSGIEEGDPTLNPEVSLKNTLSIQGRVKGKLFFETLLYYQNIDDYIFQMPQDEVRLTIRGAFPLFSYEQTDAAIYGLDVSATYQATARFNSLLKYSYLKGHDRKNDVPLVNMPANNIYGELNYQFPEIGQFQNIELQINNRFVFEQKNLLATQDFVAPPEAYNLLGLKVSAEVQLKEVRLNIFIKVENLLNETYRDYLNRQRYFADDLGINIIAGFHASF